MLGLAYRDVLIFWRRNSKKSYIYNGVLFLVLAFAVGRFGAAAYMLLMAMAQMTTAPVMLKEADTNYKGRLFSLSLPCSEKDVVRGRFLAAFFIQIPYLISMPVFSVLHHLAHTVFTPDYYIKLMLSAWICGIIITAINLTVSFAAGMDVVSVLYTVLICLLVVGYLVVMLLDIDLSFLFVVNEWLLIAAGFVLAFAVAGICYMLAVKIYRKQKK